MGETEKKIFIIKALDAFVENGIDKTTMRMLCRSTGVNPNTIYKEFLNKDEIVLACGLHITSLLETELRAVLHTMPGDFETIGEMFFEVFDKRKEEIRFCIQIMSSPGNVYIAPGTCEELRVYSDEISDYLGFDKDKFEVWFRLFISVMYHYCMTGDAEGARLQRKSIYHEVAKIAEK